MMNLRTGFLVLIVLFVFNNAYTQNTLAYQLLSEASSAKNKEKNCPKAIELYARSFSVKDFQRPFFYQAIASCYAQTRNDPQALVYLNKMLELGWIDGDSLLKDEMLTSLLRTSAGKSFLAKTSKAKGRFQKSLSPADNGLSENSAVKIVDRWAADPTINGQELFRRISAFNEFPQPKKTGMFVKFTNKFTDKISAPYYVYIPSKYDASGPHSVLVYSQGGWFQRKEFARDEAKEFVFENPVLPFVEKENVLEIFPGAANSVGTYQYEGIENIRQILAQVKQLFNVDDNRVYMMGFSDGATGTYRTSVFMPTAFAAFYAINGRPYTGNHFVNMSSRPMYTLSSDKDEVVEIDTIRSFFNYGQTVGTDWTYRELADQGHFYLPFLEDYLPAIFGHMRTMSRRPFRSELFWETTWEPIGKIDWMEITEIDKARPRADWHKEYEYPVKSREGIETVKIGNDSAAVKAKYSNNIFDVHTSCVAKFTLKLHPVMVDLGQPVKVLLNGKIVFNQIVGFDKEMIVGEFRKNRDRSLLWTNKVVIDVAK